ncbi:hypothetical protein Fcan01_13468 [Folsomia candida]|uniref:Non-structural maintenance of chromosomes element 4 n=1 Tax=Folsomia candida TaxID=158441 RepID=A0A226E4N9_FOLCA|nr:hypothetical protein Fcan01_13468 [Folsomia candida]
MSRSTRAARKRDEPEPEPETSMALASMADESASPPKAPKLLSEDESSEESDDSECGSGTTTVSSVPDATGGALRRKYNKLIDDCRKLEKREGFSSDVQAVMTKNIQSASSLFQQLSHTQPQVASENANRSQIMTETVGSTPGDLYMAFLHTKMISEVLRSKTDSIGASNSGFKMDEFISNVKRKAVTDADDLPAYSSKIVSKFLSMEFAVASKTLPLVTAVVGSFDRDAISVPKEKKPRAPIVRKRFDDVEKTQEEVNLVHYNKSEGPQKLAHHLSRLLRQHTRIHTEPTTLYEFCLDPGSLNKSIESIFYVAFLVHDGVAGLHKLAGSPMKDFAIEVKPEKRTEEDEQQQKQISSRRNTRNQYILSFSARMFKKLCQAASGDPIIPPYATMEGLQAMAACHDRLIDKQILEVMDTTNEGQGDSSHSNLYASIRNLKDIPIPIIVQVSSSEKSDRPSNQVPPQLERDSEVANGPTRVHSVTPKETRNGTSFTPRPRTAFTAPLRKITHRTVTATSEISSLLPWELDIGEKSTDFYISHRSEEH